MNIHLVVVQAFGPHAKGALVTDPTDIATILASDHSGHVVRIAAPEPSPTATDAAPAAILLNQEA